MSWSTTLNRILRRLPLILLALSCYTIIVLYVDHQRVSIVKKNQRELSQKLFQDTRSQKPTLLIPQANKNIPTKIVEILKTKIVTRIVYRTQPTSNTTRHVNQEYVKYTNLDVTTGNMSCDGEECSTWRSLTPVQAKLLCDAFVDKCQGFTIHSSQHVFFKSYIKGMLTRSLGNTLFVKKSLAQGLEKPLDMCAVDDDDTDTDVTVGCKLAKFNAFDQSIMKFIKKMEPLHCNGKQITSYRNGVIDFLPGTKVNKAVYFPITRIPGKDWGYNIGQNISLDVNLKQIRPVHHEFIRVETKTADNESHVEYHAAVVPKPDALTRPRINTGNPLNVMMVGFDSISRAHFERVFPEAYHYMSKELKTVFMNGYSIVGDGTTPALTAFLTGHFEKELPEARRGFKDSAPVDRWPWIFKEYKSAGYATMFSEDCPDYAAFNYRLHGFNNTPTDHFSRYFWESAKMTQAYCIHSKPQHLIHLDYIESFFEAYPNTPKMGVAFFTDVSHNNLNTVQLAVEDFTKFIKNLKSRGFLNNTLLVMFGDHGFRYGDSRATLQGHLEERLPLLAFTFPEWFENQHPEILKILRHNADLVTSPFDVHATLRHIITFPDVPTSTNHSRGTSLFQEIPKSRDCETAGVAEHYCPCLNIKAADTKHRHIKLGSEALVNYINNMLESDERSDKLCHKLKLKKILSSLQQIPNAKFQQFLGSADIHGRVPKFSKKNHLKECNYRIQIQTSPGDGLFEAPLKFNDGNFTITGDISRINKYGEQPRCILDKRPDLRKYCLCQDYMKTSQTP